MIRYMSRHKLIIRLLAFIISFMIVNFAGDRYFPDNEWEFWGLILFAVLVLIPQGIIFPIVRSLGYKNDSSPCLKYSSQCCVEYFKDELATKFREIITIDEKTMRNFQLSRFDDMVKIVDLFSSSKVDDMQKSFKELINDTISEDRVKGAKKEIWFFSYEISLDSFLGKTYKTLSLISHDVTLFYFYIRKDASSARERAKLSELYKGIALNFVNIPIEQPQASSAINVLPEILGSVVFIFRLEKEEPSFASYFVLKGKSKDSIYFRMPYCMNEDYYKYLNSLRGGA